MAESSTLTHKDRAEPSTPESTRSGVFFTPRVDIYETENELILYADLPGVRSENVDLNYERGELVLHARVQPRHEDAAFAHEEYEVGDYHRVFAVHESIDASKIEAECKNGVLTVHLPKAEAARSKRIEVRGK